MTNLSDLIERVEAAGEGSRSLDGAIAAAIGLNPEWAPKHHNRQPELFSDGGAGLRARTWLAPKFTSSLDAAMTLYVEVPDRVPSRPLTAVAEALRQRENLP